jgi:hypothetical protein
MSEENIRESMRELFRVHRDAQDKYAYFLLAAVGAGIALALNQTHELPLAWSQVPLGLAIACWGLSFFAGCRHLEWVATTMHANMALLQLAAGEHPRQPDHPQETLLAMRGVKTGIDTTVNKGAWWAIAQFRLLIAGACLYIGWHVLEMLLRR